MTNGTPTSILDQMYAKDRVIISASLKLENGHFLQPTGFPDIGPCMYTDGEGQARCLIESEQSMANRLEAVCMKSPGVWVDVLDFLPVIEVRDSGSGDLLATNLTEPHRLASSYILEGTVQEKKVVDLFRGRIGLTDDGSSWALDKRGNLEKLVFALDPAALLHGFQFIQWKFVGLRQTRIISSRLECVLSKEPEVHYGMVKFDAIEPAGQGEKSNKGQSIAAKSRVVPARKGIEATFDIDLLALKSLDLDGIQKKFLLALALWKIGAFLSNKPAFDVRSRQTGPALRLRADCYLSLDGTTVKWSETPNGLTLADLTPDLTTLQSRPEFVGVKDNSELKLEIATVKVGSEDKKLPRLRVKYQRKKSEPAPLPTSEAPDADEPEPVGG